MKGLRIHRWGYGHTGTIAGRPQYDLVKSRTGEFCKVAVAKKFHKIAQTKAGECMKLTALKDQLAKALKEAWDCRNCTKDIRRKFGYEDNSCGDCGLFKRKLKALKAAGEKI